LSERSGEFLFLTKGIQEKEKKGERTPSDQLPEKEKISRLENFKGGREKKRWG